MKFQVGENVLMVKSYGNLDDFWWHGTVESVTKTRVKVAVSDPQGRSGVLEFTNKNPREYGGGFEGWREYGANKWHYSDKTWTLLKDDQNSRPHYEKSLQKEAEKERQRQEIADYKNHLMEYRLSRLVPLFQEAITPDFIASLPYDAIDYLNYNLRPYLSEETNQKIKGIYEEEPE